MNSSIGETKGFASVCNAPTHVRRGSGQPVVLNIGNDEPLLSYRAEVLKIAGFDVLSMYPTGGYASQVDAVCREQLPAFIIACHTLSPMQRVALARHLRAGHPHLKLLALTAGHLTTEEAIGYDLLLDSLEGPAALIEMLRNHL